MTKNINQDTLLFTTIQQSSYYCVCSYSDMTSRQLPQNPRSSLNSIYVIANPILMNYFKMLNITNNILTLKKIGIKFQKKVLFELKDINV